VKSSPALCVLVCNQAVAEINHKTIPARIQLLISNLCLEYFDNAPKIGLTKLLYQKGYSRTGVLNLYAFIDWVLALPDALEKIFLEDLREFEKEKKMPYITSAERIGRKEGQKEGQKEGRKEGAYNTCVNLIQNMKKNNLTGQEIARLTNLDIEIVNKILNKEQIEIPLHLLNRDG
jgi:flagellar biosynthesis/type III secretory pathway protein FliH